MSRRPALTRARTAQGDFTPGEKEALLQAGALGVGLGELRLRTETAALAVLSACAML